MKSVGLPVVRFRAAVPPELFWGSDAHAVGRRDGFAAAAVEKELPLYTAAQERVYGVRRSRSAGAATTSRARTISIADPRQDTAGDEGRGFEDEEEGGATQLQPTTPKRLQTAERMASRRSGPRKLPSGEMPPLGSEGGGGAGISRLSGRQLPLGASSSGASGARLPAANRSSRSMRITARKSGEQERDADTGSSPAPGALAVSRRSKSARGALAIRASSAAADEQQPVGTFSPTAAASNRRSTDTVRRSLGARPGKSHSSSGAAGADPDRGRMSLGEALSGASAPAPSPRREALLAIAALNPSTSLPRESTPESPVSPLSAGVSTRSSNGGGADGLSNRKSVDNNTPFAVIVPGKAVGAGAGASLGSRLRSAAAAASAASSAASSASKLLLQSAPETASSADAEQAPDAATAAVQSAVLNLLQKRSGPRRAIPPDGAAGQPAAAASGHGAGLWVSAAHKAAAAGAVGAGGANGTGSAATPLKPASAVAALSEAVRKAQAAAAQAAAHARAADIPDMLLPAHLVSLAASSGPAPPPPAAHLPPHAKPSALRGGKLAGGFGGGTAAAGKEASAFAALRAVAAFRARAHHASAAPAVASLPASPSAAKSAGRAAMTLSATGTSRRALSVASPTSPPEIAPLESSTSADAGSSGPAAAAAPEGEPASALAAGVFSEQLVSTAFVYAFLWSSGLVPGEVLARRFHATALYFHRQPGAKPRHSFAQLCDFFLVMLGPENMISKRHWLRRARLWRFILLQDPSGAWDATPGLGVALQCVRAKPREGYDSSKRVLLPVPALMPRQDPLEAGAAMTEGAGADAATTKALCPFSGSDWTAIEYSVSLPEEQCTATALGIVQ